MVNLQMSMSDSKCKDRITKYHATGLLDGITRLEKKCEKLSKNAKAFLDAMRGNTRERY